MSNVTCLATGPTRGASAARQIVRNPAKSSYVQFSKAFINPLRARPAADRLEIICSYGRDPKSRQGSNSFNQRRKDSRTNDFLPRKTPPSYERISIVVREFAIPAIGVLAVATVLGPLIGAIALSAFGFAMAVAAVAAFFSLSWIFIPVILSFMGLPLLFGGGLATSIFAGAAGVFLFPALLQIGLITASLYLGTKVAQAMLSNDTGRMRSDDAGIDGTIDVEADTFDSIEYEMEMEAKKREQELKAFDDLLRRREKFQRGGGDGDRY